MKTRLDGSERILPERWTYLEPHPEQRRLYHTSKARFRVAPPGRRSGKTELAKRFIVKKAMNFDEPNGRFVCSAPTREQAKSFFWEDLKLLVPEWYMVGRPRENDLTIKLANSAIITVMSMERAERIEGAFLDGIILDEYADMREDVWTRHVRPALSTKGRLGWAWFIGVPEGRNHYYKLAQEAQIDETGEWDYFWWPSSDILDAEEIAAARRDLDPLSFQQEYEGQFVLFEGRAYYSYTSGVHASERLQYDSQRDLIICFDFNVDPGVAAYVQEQTYSGNRRGKGKIADMVTAVIGEVYIPKNSNTPAVCRRIEKDWGKKHKGYVYCYGDPSGGARGTAKVAGSDWDIIKTMLRPVFGERLRMRNQRKTPSERSRVNAVNTRLLSAEGKVRLLVCPKGAPNTVLDFEGVTTLKGGSGELDKNKNQNLTHLTDAISYYIHEKYPISRTFVRSMAVL